MSLILEPIKIRIKIPMVPNFLFSERGQQFAVWEMDEKMLRSLGRQWTQKLIENARRKRKLKESEKGGE